jgi:probable UDP-sugar transporter A4
MNIFYLQAFCGLLMSSVMKHGSNIIRLFVISGAMVVAMVLSVVIFGLKLNFYIITASIIVLTALALYHKK